MRERTIMIFPKFKNIDVIDNIRKKYDPLYCLVKPHITLVFPFLDNLENERLIDLINERLEDLRIFDISLKGISKSTNEFGNYIFLVIKEGREELKNIHELLYDSILKKFLVEVEYIPHLTVGKFKNIMELEKAFNELKDIEDNFVTTIDKISIEEIGDNGESIIIYEKDLK